VFRPKTKIEVQLVVIVGISAELDEAAATDAVARLQLRTPRSRRNLQRPGDALLNLREIGFHDGLVHDTILTGQRPQRSGPGTDGRPHVRQLRDSQLAPLAAEEDGDPVCGRLSGCRRSGSLRPAAKRSRSDSYHSSTVVSHVTRSTGGPLIGVVDGDGVDDEHVWWALNLLYGVDLRHHPTGPYLHDDRQIQDWLGAFRQRCSGNAVTPTAVSSPRTDTQERPVNGTTPTQLSAAEEGCRGPHS
jgi:hypothetical protein